MDINAEDWTDEQLAEAEENDPTPSGLADRVQQVLLGGCLPMIAVTLVAIHPHIDPFLNGS